MAKSIYLGWRSLPSDVQVQSVDHSPAQPQSGVPAAPTPQARRRANPANTLLPATRAWMAALPPQVRPTLLAAQFARIANQLCLRWQDPDDCHAYFEELLEDRRGSRKGFPVGVLRELQALRRYFEEVSAGNPQADRWADVR